MGYNVYYNGDRGYPATCGERCCGLARGDKS